MNTQSLLVWDSFSAHLTDTVKQQLRENKTATTVIPGGLTSLVQQFVNGLRSCGRSFLRKWWNALLRNVEFQTPWTEPKMI